VKIRLRGLLPAGFRGQVAGIVFLGLALSQVLAALVYMVVLPHWTRVLRPETALTKIDMAVRALEAVPAPGREALARAFAEPGFRIAYRPGPDALPGQPASPGARMDPELRAQVAAKLARPLADVAATDVAAGAPGPLPAPGGFLASEARAIEVQLRGGGVLAVQTPIGVEHRFGLLQQAAALVFMAIVLAALWAWLTWAVQAPLERFAQAAERVGTDADAPALPEQGPAQLRRAIRAFNEMQVRVKQFLRDRTLMLGAISHDLRTPLTRLRLRIETGRVEDDRARMLADIETMERMLTATLNFIRGGDDPESVDAVDLSSLLETVCDMVTDLGGVVEFSGPPHMRYPCRAQSLMRALTNVVGNAAKYGGAVQVRLGQDALEGVCIDIEDDGPGLSDADKARVFEPFYRVAAAREIDSQGMGLGLSIARSAILAHGGTIVLRDRQPHGLWVHIALPPAQALRAPPRPPDAA
jgi:signal transduction histidine kinase